MKPELKTYTVTLEKQYWTCNIPEHRHTTKQIAINCMKIKKGGKKKGKLTLEELKQISIDRNSGMTYKELGIKWKRSSGRMGQIVADIKRSKERDEQLQVFKQKYGIEKGSIVRSSELSENNVPQEFKVSRVLQNWEGEKDDKPRVCVKLGETDAWRDAEILKDWELVK